MLARHEPRKALAVALSRLVLSHETILRHAQTVLRAPELVELPVRASALDLWLEVLRRAELEATLPLLIDAVLEENPGATELRAAFQQYSERQYSEQQYSEQQGAAPPEPPADSAPGEPQRPAAGHAPSGRGSEWARRALLLVGCGVLAWRLVHWQLSNESASTEPASAPQQARSALQPGASPRNEFVEQLLACWRDNEGSRAETPASVLRVNLQRSAGQERSRLEVSVSPAARSSPGDTPPPAAGFEDCARASASHWLARLSPGQALDLELPLPPAAR